MGLYIPLMELPKNCLECSFKFEDIKYGDGCCLFTGIVCLSIGRQDRCPLIEINEKAFNEVIEGYLEGLKAIQNAERREDL